jgi:hypothetical protein
VSIFDEWKSYERDVVPKDAVESQREECRRAFYAGAQACLTAVYEATDVADDGQAAEAALTALDQELKAVVNDLRMT